MESITQFCVTQFSVINEADDNRAILPLEIRESDKIAQGVAKSNIFKRPVRILSGWATMVRNLNCTGHKAGRLSRVDSCVG